MAELDDTTLVAYVDGELDAATAREVEQALETSPAARSTVARLRSSASLVRAAFADAVHEPPPARLVELLRAAPPNPRPAARWLRVAAAIIVALAVGGALGVGLVESGYLVRLAGLEPTSERIADEVASYHRVYAREQRHLVEVGASDTPHIEDWLGHRLKAQLQIPNLSAQGLNFRGGRLLVFDDRPMAQLIYTPPDGPPLGLCITFAETGMSGSKTDHRGDLTIVQWTDNGYVYSVVGWDNDRRIHAIADSVRAQLHL